MFQTDEEEEEGVGEAWPLVLRVEEVEEVAAGDHFQTLVHICRWLLCLWGSNE